VLWAWVVFENGAMANSQGWKMASKKPTFLRLFKKPKNLKSPKCRFLGLFFIFLVKFCAYHI